MFNSEYAHALKFRIAYGLNQAELKDLIAEMGKQGKADVYWQWHQMQKNIWEQELTRKKHAQRLMALRGEIEDHRLHANIEPHRWPPTTWFFGVFPSVPDLLRNEYPVLLFADKMLEYLFALTNFLGTDSVATGLTTLEMSIYDERGSLPYFQEKLLKSLKNPTSSSNGASSAISSIEIDNEAYVMFQTLFFDASLIHKRDAANFLNENGYECVCYVKGISKNFINDDSNNKNTILSNQSIPLFEKNIHVTTNTIITTIKTENNNLYNTTNNQHIHTEFTAKNYSKNTDAKEEPCTKTGMPNEIVIESEEWDVNRR